MADNKEKLEKAAKDVLGIDRDVLSIQREIEDAKQKILEHEQKTLDITRQIQQKQVEINRYTQDQRNVVVDLENQLNKNLARLNEIQSRGLALNNLTVARTDAEKAEQATLALEALQLLRNNSIVQERIRLENQLLPIRLQQMGIERDQLEQDLSRSKHIEFIDSITRKMGPEVQKLADIYKGIVKDGFTWSVLFQLTLDRFIELDKAAEEFRKNTGLTINQSAKLREQAELTNLQYQEMGVSIERVYLAQAAIVNTFGNANAVSKDMSETVALLALNLGVAEEDSANVLQNFMGMGNYSKEASTAIIRIGASLSKAAGVPFPKVMHDIATASSTVSTTLGTNPGKLMAAAIGARILGIDLNTAAENSRRLLDFSTNINAEMDASALLGRNVNFQYARQLAFQNDILGSQTEALRVVKAAGDWNQMNVYQREALAKASGMEVKDMTKLLALDKIRNSSSPEGERLRMLEGQQKEMNKLLGSQEQQLINQKEQELLDQQMQGRLTNLNNSVKKILISIGTFLEPVIRMLSDVLVPVLDSLGDGLSKVSQWTGTFEKSIVLLVGAVALLSAGLVSFIGVGKLFSGFSSLITAPFNAISKGISQGISYFGKPDVLLGAASMLIMASSVYVLAKGLNEFNTVDWSSLGKAAVAIAGVAAAAAILGIPAVAALVGLGAVVIAGLGLALIPFAFAAKLAGEAMIPLSAGLTSLIKPISDIAAPFAVLASLYPGLMLASVGIAAVGAAMVAFGAGSGLSSIISKLTGGNSMVDRLSQLASLGDGLMKTATALGLVADALVKIKDVGEVDIGSLSKSVPTTVISQAPTNTTTGNNGNDALLAKVSELVELMKSGGIAVNLDGRLVSKQIASLA